jgi:thiol-disulfide isomerase/thioredoxin
MGKASRTKRERREQGGREATIAAAAGADSRQLPVFWIVVALLVVAGLVALVVTAPDDKETAAQQAAAAVPTYEDVTVDGAELPKWGGAGEDDAIGKQVPTLGGTSFEQMRTTWSGDDGVARAYVVVAHWCPHCRDEVPRLVEWSKDNDVPAGVEIVTVSTAVDEGQPNFPPAAWLTEEQWPYDVMIDDEIGTAAEALGVEGYPYLVFVDRDGVVQERYSGEMPVEEFDAAIAKLATPATEDAKAA